MNITFDPRDPSQLSAVAKIIDVMSGGNVFAPITTDPDKFKLDGSEDVPAPVESTVAAQTAADIDGALPLPTPAQAAPPVAETPATPPASPTPQQPIGDVDATGMPWDERIHAGTKSQKKDGTWTLKRGVDKDLVKQVEAELRAQMAPPPAVPVPQGVPVTAPPAQAAPPVATPAPMAMPAGDVEMPVASGIPMPAGDQPASAAAPPAQAAPAPAVAQAAPPAAAPPAQAAGAPLDFTGLMTKVSQSMNTGKITGDYLGTVVSRLNAQVGTQFTAITDLSQAPEHIATVDAMIAADQCW